MYAGNLLCALITITTAAAAVFSSSQPSSNTNVELTVDDVILFGVNGKVNVVSRTEFEEATNRVPIATAEQHDAEYSKYTRPDKREAEKPTRTIEKRCLKHTIWTMNPVETFYDWDIAMSGIVRAPQNDSASLKISEGVSLGNSLSVSSSSKFDLVAKFLSGGLGISFGSSWTTTRSSGYVFTVPPGKYGAIVSNPMTTRHSGYTDVGCIGSAERTEFSSNSYQSKAYSNLNWVDGVIGVCIGDTLPLPRCHGNGTL
ncbi:hypothetical protein K3495_g7243 [Podosphaera aphanis]|nr:hypothetical protein K3495_g7243 [Podosphaera aphanis]